MEMSPTVGKLAAALSKFQSQVTGVTKDANNPFFKSQYVTLEAAIAGTQKARADNGLSVVQLPEGENGLATILMHESGEWIKSSFTFHPVKNDPQALGSAITYARRYAFMAVLGLAAEDDDGNAASAPKKPVQKQTEANNEKKEVATDSVKEEKRQIVALLKKLKAPCNTKVEAEESVKRLTQFELKEENFEKIIDLLTVLSKEQVTYEA